jgi:hypothetical protein
MLLLLFLNYSGVLLIPEQWFGGPIHARQFICATMVSTCFSNVFLGLSSCLLEVQSSYDVVVVGFVLCLRAYSLVHLTRQDDSLEADFLVVRVR